MTAFEKYEPLYIEAVAERATIDARIQRRYDIYFGSKKTLDFTNPNRTWSKKDVIPFRKMCFELIESQVDVSIPLAKITPRYAEDAALAADLEEFLNTQADAMNSEDINDIAEREVRVQGTGIYHIDWDETLGGPRRHGDLVLSFIRMKDFYPQPHIENPDDLEYVFIHVTTTIDKVKTLYGKDVLPDDGSKTSVTLVICWYLNDKGEVSKLIWTKIGREVLLDTPNYYSRKRQVCSQCAEIRPRDGEKCPVCGNTSWKWVTIDEETLPEDLYVVDKENSGAEPKLYMAKGTPITYYKIKTLPFVIRHNMADARGGLYGISDVDLLEETQDGNNKIINKIAENVMAGGTIVTLPANVPFENQAGTLKTVRIQDPRQKQLVGAYPIQANVQQDDIVQDRLYQIGRQSVGITDAYQGKRDPTAESGKAKEISAMQTAGRLESKYVDKLTAYSKIYRRMFEFLLAFSDEKRRLVRPYFGMGVEETTFSKYSFLLPDKKKAIYNDDFIFATNGSYVLSNKKEALWKVTTETFMAGALGNPQDPRVVWLYWNIMNRYNYPLASKVLQMLASVNRRLPLELEQALLANPELINELMMVIQAKAQIAEKKAEIGAGQAASILDPALAELDDENTVDDTKKTKKTGGTKK